jgi:hypothetical protein
MEILATLKDKRAVVPIAVRLLDFSDRQAASNALKAMGPMMEVPEVVSGPTNKDAGVRTEVS